VTVEINGAGVVVTGAGAGIGRALARGLAGAGARVVVNDLNFEAATAVAREIGGYPAPGDVSTAQGVHDLVDAAREYLNEVNIYCSNAGVAVGAGPDAPDAAWQQSWEVNLMAHVRASRELAAAASW
jgi:NAD(P)-dependent dehydrogenase (short-subunit alcohol dehydrogenase family)